MSVFFSHSPCGNVFRPPLMEQTRSIVAAYNYTCALTGYRLTTVNAGSIVDAAHIHQFADSRNNDPRNGVALCKNAHWLFDNGLWTIAGDYSVIVAVGRFSEDSPDHKSLRDYHGQKVCLPSDNRLWPKPDPSCMASEKQIPGLMLAWRIAR